MPTVLAAAGALVALAAASASGQLAATLDAGASSVRYEGYLRSSVITVAPLAWLDIGRTTLATRGTLSLFESGSRSVDARIAASTFTGPVAGWRGEIAGRMGGSVFNEIATTYAGGELRAHRMRAHGGIWLGAGGAWIGDALSDPGSFRAGAGGWMRRGTATATAGASYTTMVHVDNLDFEGAARWNLGRVELTASVGARASSTGDDAPVWGELGTTVWLAPRFAVVAGYGRYPADHPQSQPGGRYAALAVRVASRAPQLADALARARRYEAPRIATPAVAGFEVRDAGAGLRRIRVRSPGAATVEVVGDFTDWEPVLLVRQRDGSWQADLPLAPGTYRINVRVNGGEWGVPPGVGVIRDEFGGVVGLLVVGAAEKSALRL